MSSLADQFNHLFANNTSTSTISKTGQMKIESNYHSFYFFPTFVEELRNILNQLAGSNSSGVDGISTFFIKKSDDSFAEPLCHLINHSFSTGCFPDNLKNAQVVPHHKKGCANHLNPLRFYEKSIQGVRKHTSPIIIE